MRISDWSSDVCSSDLRVVISGRAARQAMSEKAPGTPWKAITLSAAAGAFLLASDITCKLSPSRVRRRPGQRQDLGCEASVGQRRRGRESALSGRSEEHTSELQSLMRHSYAVF